MAPGSVGGQQPSRRTVDEQPEAALEPSVEFAGVPPARSRRERWRARLGGEVRGREPALDEPEHRRCVPASGDVLGKLSGPQHVAAHVIVHDAQQVQPGPQAER